MAKKAELRAVLKLDNIHFVRNIRRTLALVRDLARQFARSPVSTTFLAGIFTARQAIKTAAKGIELFGDIARRSFKYAAIAGGIATAAFIAVGASSIHAASDMEKYLSAFTVLLKSTELAKDRMKQLLFFANDSGLRLTAVAEASRSLETLTVGALSGVTGLKMIADIAKGTTKDFNQLAITIGRVYDSLRSGTSAGEELRRLQEIGAITGTQRRRIEALSSVEKGAQAWKELQGALSRYNGMVEQMSGNWESRMERFKDSIDEAKRQFGKPLMDTLKPTLSALTNTVFGLGDKFHELGVKFASGIDFAIKVLVGAFANPAQIIGPLEHGLAAVMKSTGNLMVSVFETALKTAFSAEFFNSLASSFFGLANIIAGHLMNAFKKPIAQLQAGAEVAFTFVDKQLARADFERATKRLDEAESGIDIMFSDRNARIDRDPEAKANFEKNKSDAIAEFNDAFREHSRLKAIYEGKPQDNFGEIVNRNLQNSDGNALIKQGEDMMKKGMGDVFSKIKENWQIKDVFGAGESVGRMMEGMRVLAKQGDAFIKEAERVNPLKAVMDSMKAVAHMATVESTLASWSPKSRLRSGGLFSSSMAKGFGGAESIFGSDGVRRWKPGTLLDDPAIRNTPLLKMRERKSLENQRVADLMARGATNVRQGISASPGGYNRVSRGDRKRMQEVQRERLREAAGVERSNQLLEAIQKRFDEFVKG